MSWLEQFIVEQRLTASYAQLWNNSYAQIASWVRSKVLTHPNEANRPFMLGLSGCQGSGKSTLSAALVSYFQKVHNIRAVCLSLDDVYYTKAQRLQLAHDVHPLLATRGVPGTHDLDLLKQTFLALAAESGQAVVPRFDKSADDRCPRSAWTTIDLPVNLVIVEGWCLGVGPQSANEIAEPCNDFERNQDADAVWRRYVNNQLAQSYPAVYDHIDSWLMLQAPSFNSVFRWRCEQETKLRENPQSQGRNCLSDSQVYTFIQYFQRLTEHALTTLPSKVDVLVQLDESRNVNRVCYPQDDNALSSSHALDRSI